MQTEIIDRIPKGRDFTSILNLAPGAQAEAKAGGQIQVDGASGSENRFIIDGMDTTALQTGVSGKQMLLDFIQEVQVKSSGYNAEFGGATGGVVSAITKSGSNKIRGSIGTYFYNRPLNENGIQRPSVRFSPYNSALPERGQVYPESTYSNWNPIGDIGGPVFKDRLWYYVGLAYSKTSNSRDVTFYSDPTRTSRHFDWWSNAKYYNYNVTAQVSNNLRLKFAGSNQRNANRGTAPGFGPQGYVYPDGTVANTPYSTSTFDMNPDGTLNQTAYNNRWVRTGANSLNDTYAGNVDWVISPKFFVNAAGGYYKTDNTTPAEFRGNAIVHNFQSTNSDAYMDSQGFPHVPSQYQQVSGYTDNISNSGTEKNIFTRAFFNGNTTFFLSKGGQHTFKAGVRYERFTNDVLDGQTFPNILLTWGQKYTTVGTGEAVAGTYGYYIVRQSGTIGKVNSNNWSFWVQDSWTVNNKLTINAGVRDENEYVPSYKDPVQFPDALSIKFGFGEKIAPRVGFAYDLKGDGQWKAYGSFGFYYDITKLELPRGSFGGDHWIDYAWTLNTPDYASIQCGEGTTGCPGTFIEWIDYRHSSNQVDPLFEAYFNRPGMTGIDPNLKPVKTGETTFGLDHELNPTMSIGVRYVHKWMFRTIEDTGIWTEGNEDYLIANPGEGLAVVMEPAYPSYTEPKPKRNYDSFEVRLNKRLSKNWSTQASYMYSHLYGNYSGLASGDENGRVSPNVNRYYDNTIMSYGSDGKPIYGVLPTDRPHTVKVNATYDFKFGTSVGAFFIVDSGTPQTSIVRLSGYPVMPFGRNDLGRSPWFNQTDLQLSQDIRVGGTRRVLLMLNVSNLFDQAEWTNYYPYNLYGPQQYRDSISLGMPPTNPPSGPFNAGILYQTGGYDIKSIINSYTGTKRINPFYTEPYNFQGRRSMRVMAKFTF
jgi:hypothetical protein